MPQPNMQQMAKMMQKMQADMAKAQEELKTATVEATVGGGAVTVEVTGELIFKSIKIAPEAVDPDDPEMLADLVLAAVNQGVQAAQELQAEKMGAATGGLGGLAGGLGGLGLPGF